MLSIGRVGPAGGDYYLASVASSPEAYYLGAGEAPGWWTGAGAGELGVAGEVTPEGFARLLDGRHPMTGARLVAGGREDRVGGFDLTFSAPKSVSLLWALHPDPVVRAGVAEAHRAAIGDALGYLEGHAAWARRGRNGLQRVPVTGLVAAAFEHRTSRADDPQLHAHVVVANLVADHAGRWSAPDSRALYRHARTAGHVYQARLRHDLTRQLGVTWGPVRNGQADLAGIERTGIDAFSTRRAQVVDALDARGLSSSTAARVATLDTRPAKTVGAQVGLLDGWAARAAEAGLDVEGLAGPGRQVARPDPSVLVDRLVGAEGLTAHASTFDRRDLTCGLAAAHPDGATLAQLEDLAGRVTGSDRVVDLAGDDVGAEARWTTLDHLAVEADVAALAVRPWEPGTRPVGVASVAAVDRAVAARPGLSIEQARVVAGITTSPARVVTVVGQAGAGKTYALDAARAAWAAGGTPVVGAALAARAAAELEAGAGIPSTTLARLTADLSRPEGRLLPGSVIVVDESGMVGTRDLHRLLRLADQQRAKVVLVGDPAQLPEIAAGGTFAHLTATTPTWELATNRRQAEGWERAALDQLRHRQAGPALARYGAQGRITLAGTAGDLRAQMAADWHQARAAGAEVVMLAARRADVADLNTRAQAELITAGRLDPDGPSVDLGGGQRALTGDELICGRNDRQTQLLNGTRLTVTHLDPDTHTITGISPDGRGVVIPGGYVDAGHVDLGYASTIHKVQGRTVDQALLLGDDRLFAEAGYVGLSRGRHANQLYVVAPTDPFSHVLGSDVGLADDVCRALGTSRAQARATAQVTDRLPDGPLGSLVASRDRLAADLFASLPRSGLAPVGPAGGQGVLLRDDWTAAHREDGERLARLAAGVDRRHERLGRAALADPPSHLVALLGPPPEGPAARRSWTRAAADLEAWREVSGRPVDRGSKEFLASPGVLDPSHSW